ncbi:MAG: acyl carrier protein [candidate division Zixibacteria bacterium]|nr:acyl carrier protein [candidate division Zixibacteria bacterium]
MDKETVRQDIRGFIEETFLFGEDTDKLNDSDSFMQNGIVDSTGILEVTSYVEEKYDISIENDEMVPANLDSIENLSNFISRKANG